MSTDYTQQITQAAQAQGIDPNWALAVARTESADNPNAVSSAGAQGLFQLLPSTASALGVTDPMDPAQNIAGGVKLLAQNLQRYGNPAAATAAYFGGTDPNSWGPKTAAYVQKVTSNMPSADNDPGFDAWLNQNTSGQSAPAESGATPESDPGFDAWMKQNTASAPSSQAPAGAPAGSVPSTLDQITAGIGRGLHVLTDVPAEALASGVGAATHAMGLAPNWTPGADTIAADRAATQQFQQQYGNAKPLSPENVANIATQLGGGAAALGAGEGVLNAGARAIGAAAPALAPALTNTARFLTGGAGQFSGAGAGNALLRVGSLAAEGAGGTAAFDELTGRPITPGQVAAGAVMGPVVAGAGALGARAANGLLSGATPAETRAAQAIYNAAQADSGLGAGAAAPGDSLATMGGANVQGLAEGLANKPGPGQSVVRSYFNNLMEQQPDVIAQAVKGAMGSNGPVSDLVANVMQQRSQQAAPLFEKAFETPVSPEATAGLQKMIDAPRGQQAVQTALVNLQDLSEKNGTAFNPNDYGISINDAGKVQLIPGADSMPFLHAVKEGFDDNIEGMRDLTTGRLPNTKEAINLDNIRSNFRNALIDATPEYGDALAAWSGPSRAIDAARLGTKVFNNDPDVTAQRVAAMDESEKAAYQAGVGQAIMQKIGSVQDGGKVARIFSVPNVRAKVAAAFDSPDEAQQFFDTAERLNAQANARNIITGNSRTALRGAQQGHDWSNTALEAGSNLLAARPHIALFDLLRGLGAHAQAQGNPEYESALANLLTSPYAEAVPKVLRSGRPGVVSRGVNALLSNKARLGGELSTLGWAPNPGAGTGQ